MISVRSGEVEESVDHCRLALEWRVGLVGLVGARLGEQVQNIVDFQRRIGSAHRCGLALPAPSLPCPALPCCHRCGCFGGGSGGGVHGAREGARLPAGQVDHLPLEPLRAVHRQQLHGVLLPLLLPRAALQRAQVTEQRRERAAPLREPEQLGDGGGAILCGRRVVVDDLVEQPLQTDLGRSELLPPRDALQQPRHRRRRPRRTDPPLGRLHRHGQHEPAAGPRRLHLRRVERLGRQRRPTGEHCSRRLVVRRGTDEPQRRERGGHLGHAPPR
mmetsp:Transcript_43960/g.141253  ORF Transcript_43960/g.141253 Transcript_43960/m.141253 type:complete len:273 (+) Transcript_43960:510-1328(+)